MNGTLIAGTALALFLGFTAIVTVWSRRDTLWRHAAVPLLVAGLLVASGAMTEPMGWGKPYALAWRIHGDKLRVRGYKFIRNKAIYVFVDAPNSAAPRLIQIPWRKDIAMLLQKAMRARLLTGADVFLQMDGRTRRVRVEVRTRNRPKKK